jgi:hypothetical protein
MHFAWEGSLIVGRTDIGRATLDVLSINSLLRVELRNALFDEGVSFQE